MSLLAAIDTTVASDADLLAALLLAQDRKLAIPRDREVSMAAAYLDKVLSNLEGIWLQAISSPVSARTSMTRPDSVPKSIPSANFVAAIPAIIPSARRPPDVRR